MQDPRHPFRNFARRRRCERLLDPARFFALGLLLSAPILELSQQREYRKAHLVEIRRKAREHRRANKEEVNRKLRDYRKRQAEKKAAEELLSAPGQQMLTAKAGVSVVTEHHPVSPSNPSPTASAGVSPRTARSI